MHELSTNLTFITDPGHGWLRVPLVDIAALGVETVLSSHSFIDGHFAYLEEDCDCTHYLEALQEHLQTKPTIQEEYREHFSRNRPRFGDTQFSTEFWEKLRN
jgi:hypothetical protein